MARSLKILITGSIVGVGVYVAAYLIVPSSFAPPEFLKARIEGAELAKTIVDSSDKLLGYLDQIAKYDTEGNTQAAFILTGQALAKIHDAQGEAIKLSSRLEAMARNLSDIKPAQARILATEAVSSEVTLVSHLIQYNDYLKQLFEVLRGKFENPSSHSNGRVKELVNKVNEEARAINDFNRRFNQSLAEFDKFF